MATWVQFSFLWHLTHKNLSWTHNSASFYVFAMKILACDNDLPLCLKRNSSTIKRLLSIDWVLELMVGTCTISSLPLTSPTRSSFSSTAARFFYAEHTHIRQKKMVSMQKSTAGRVKIPAAMRRCLQWCLSHGRYQESLSLSRPYMTTHTHAPASHWSFPAPNYMHTEQHEEVILAWFCTFGKRSQNENTMWLYLARLQQKASRGLCWSRRMLCVTIPSISSRARSSWAWFRVKLALSRAQSSMLWASSSTTICSFRLISIWQRNNVTVSTSNVFEKRHV